MHFVQSLWTKPLIVNRRNVEFKTSLLTTILCNATSVAWVNHLGGKINLYADGFGRDMLDFLPYDNIYELKVPLHIPTCTWACGKFLVLEKMPLGDVHIDGDVFLKSNKLLELCADDSYDMVVQSIENDKTTLKKYYSNVRDILKKNNIKTHSCSLEESPSYNCGTIGFFNQELKQKYLVEYFTTLNNIINNKLCLLSLNKDLNAIPDLIMEQQFLYELAKPYKVNNLLGDAESMYDKAIELNYQHILGGFKEQQLNNIMDELKYVDETIYKDTMKHINFLIS